MSDSEEWARKEIIKIIESIREDCRLGLHYTFKAGAPYLLIRMGHSYVVDIQNLTGKKADHTLAIVQFNSNPCNAIRFSDLQAVDVLEDLNDCPEVQQMLSNVGEELEAVKFYTACNDAIKKADEALPSLYKPTDATVQ